MPDERWLPGYILKAHKAIKRQANNKGNEKWFYAMCIIAQENCYF